MQKKVLIFGLGNPLLGDDGVGWRVAEEVERRLPKFDKTSEVSIDVDYSAGGGLSLMERLVDYDEAILIDAIDIGRGPIGSVYRYALDELPDQFSGHIASAHETNLQMALQVGRSLGAALPDRVTVIAIESPHVYDFTEELSSPIEAALPQAIDLVFQQLHLPQEA
jgi:hydrogenase maturation protease